MAKLTSKQNTVKRKPPSFVYYGTVMLLTSEGNSNNDWTKHLKRETLLSTSAYHLYFIVILLNIIIVIDRWIDTL